MAVLAGQVEGRPTVFFPSIRHSSFVQQKTDTPVIAILSSEMESCPLVLISLAGICSMFQQQRDDAMNAVENKFLSEGTIFLTAAFILRQDNK